MTLRQEKVAELLRHLVSEYIKRESNRTSLITVTHVDVSKDMRKATIYLSIYPEKDENVGLDFVRRNLSNIREYVKPKLQMRVLPFFECMLDIGEKNRQYIDEISSNL